MVVAELQKWGCPPFVVLVCLLLTFNDRITHEQDRFLMHVQCFHETAGHAFTACVKVGNVTFAK